MAFAEDLEWLVFADASVAKAVYGGQYATYAEAQERARALLESEQRWLQAYVMHDDDVEMILVFTVDRDGERDENELSLGGVVGYTRFRASALAEPARVQTSLCSGAQTMGHPPRATFFW